MKPSNPWEKLSDFEARRVDAGGKFDFFWVVLEAGMPGLMLRMASMPQPAPRPPKLRNLDAAFRSVPGGFAFVLGLKEKSQIDIFVALCLDVVVASESAGTADDALERALQRTRRWHHLLRGGSSGGLSAEEQRGLVAELALLRALASEFGAETAIEAWTGPNGSSKDFELIGTCIEVKAHRAAAKPFVSISSEDQLADVEACRIVLQVVEVVSAVLPEGTSLHDYVLKTATYFETESVAFQAWEDALYKTGYDPDNDYEGRRWLLGSATNFEVREGFPRLCAPLLPGVSNVKYSVSLHACEPFKLEEDLMTIVREGLPHD